MDPKERVEEYKAAIEEWKREMEEWKGEWQEEMEEWRHETEEALREGAPMPPMPAMPLMPPMPPMHVVGLPVRGPTHLVAPSRSNVVASRVGDEELRAIDMLIEAGLFSTRSEAVAYLVREGIKARKDALDKVSSTLQEIRRIRGEAEGYVTKLKTEIGIGVPEAPAADRPERRCPECGRNLVNLPEDITRCPYCGARLGEE